MDYVVRPLASVTVRLAKESRAIQDEFQQIASILALNPYPNPQFPLVTEERAPGGVRLFTFSKSGFPFAIQFLVFEPTDDAYGVIAIFNLVDLRRRRHRTPG